MAVAKVERLLVLMNVLLGAATPVSAVELHRRVPGYPEEDASFRRAFERDKEEIREMGVPLLVEPIAGTDPPLVGYRIRPQDYALADPGLDPDELEALHLAAAVVGPAGGLGQSALYKLGGTAAPGHERTEIPASPDLVAAFTGVAERRILRFGYRDLARVVHPYRLEFQRGRWYLNGFDETRGEDRWFRMSRIQGAVEIGAEAGAFDRPTEAVPGLRVEPWQLGGSAEAVTATVWFDPAVASAARAEIGDTGRVVGDDDRGLVVELPVANRSGFRSWLLSYLDRAEVLQPEALRDDVLAWLAALAGEEAP